MTFDANGGTCATDSVKVSDRAAVGELPTATRSNYTFLGWFTAAVGGEQVSTETVVTADVTWYAQWKAQETDVPTYGPWGESEDVANPDKLAPTQLKQTSVTIYDAVAANGDCVAVYRGDTDAICGLGKVLNDTGTLTIVYYAPKGVTLSFKVWKAESGVESPMILDCDTVCNLVAGKVGETVTGHKLVVSDNVDLTLALKNAGWQAVSFNVEPDDQSPDAVFAAVADKIDSVVEGVSYWEPGDEGTLAQVKVGKAYWVKTLVDNVSWTVTGKVHPETEIALKIGWNLVGYTLENEAAVEAALATALEDGAISDIVCGIDFYPDGTLAQMKPGKAYWVKATQAYALVYDDVPTVKMAASGVRAVPMMAFAAAASNPKYGPWGDEEVEVPNPDRLSPSILKKIAVTVDGASIADGDVVAAFRGDTGALCGLGVAKDGNVTIVTYVPADVELSFKLWVAESGIEESVVVEADETVVATGDNQENLTLAFSTATPTYTVGTKCSIDTGWIGYTVKNLPKGLKYDRKTGIVSGVPTAATAGKVVATFTKSGKTGKDTQTLEFEVAALPSGVTGTFNGFVVGAAAREVTRSTEDDATVNVGALQVTVSDVGKITAKVVAAAGTYSFTATGWDSVNEDVYSVEMTTKKGDVLTLACDSTAAWNDHQLTGEFVASGATALVVEAQKNAFGKQWLFNATGDDANGWTLSFAENAKAAALTVTLNADGKTSVAGKLGGYKISASGYADVSGIGNGAIFADFAPVISIKSGKTTTRKVLSLRANLWFDKKNDHEQGVGSAVFVP